MFAKCGSVVPAEILIARVVDFMMDFYGGFELVYILVEVLRGLIAKSGVCASVCRAWLVERFFVAEIDVREPG